MIRVNLKKLIQKIMVFWVLLATKKSGQYFKKFVASNSISEEKTEISQPSSDYPGIICGLCEVHKDIFNNCPPFQPILSAIITPTYKLAKFLVPISKSSTSNEGKGKDYLAFDKETVEQDYDFFMESLDIC